MDRTVPGRAPYSMLSNLLKSFGNKRNETSKKLSNFERWARKDFAKRAYRSRNIRIAVEFQARRRFDRSFFATTRSSQGGRRFYSVSQKLWHMASRQRAGTTRESVTPWGWVVKYRWWTRTPKTSIHVRATSINCRHSINICSYGCA